MTTTTRRRRSRAVSSAYEWQRLRVQGDSVFNPIQQLYPPPELFSVMPCFSMTDLSTEEIKDLLVDLMKRRVHRAFS
jgi:hypothetical protein